MTKKAKSQDLPPSRSKWRSPARWLKLGVIALFLVGAGWWLFPRFFNTEAEAVDYQNVAVDRGDISVEITGSGTIQPKDQYKVTPRVKGEVQSAPFEEGQQISKGDLLYQIDAGDVSNNIEKSQLSLERTKLNASENEDLVDGLTVTIPIDGVLSDFDLEVGDEVQKGAKIGAVENRNKMVLTVPFNVAAMGNISVGQTADVFLDDFYQSISGTVTYINSGQKVMDGSAIVKDVEITVENPGALTPEHTGYATVGGITSYASANFAYLKSTEILADSGGEVSAVHYQAGDQVTAGSVLLELTSKDVQNQVKTNDMSIREAELSLASMYDQLDDYRITSPISGTVTSKTVKAGDSVESGDEMAVIADLSQLYFDINVDELDISNIQQGQKVTVTADALPGQVFEGVVDHVSIMGTSQNVVTTYPVKVVLDASDDLLPGMNVNASIVVESKANVLRVPVAALVRGNMVLVADSQNRGQKDEMQTEDLPAAGNALPTPQNDGAKAEPDSSLPQPSDANTDNKDNASQTAARGRGGQMEAPTGYRYVEIEIGINDENYVEVMSGLNEGDLVAVPLNGESGNENANKSGMQGGTTVVTMEGPGGGGGAPPGGGGGAPSGGGGGFRP